MTVFVRGDRCYIGWLGDSQVLLVRDGQPVTVMEPHKPEREVRRPVSLLTSCVFGGGTSSYFRSIYMFCFFYSEKD